MKWNKSEIEEYKLKCLNHFNHRGGNINIKDVEEKFYLDFSIIPKENERMILSDEPLSFCSDFVEPDVEYDVFTTIYGEIS